ncbi:MAG: hypothetical protein KBF75_11815 [Saprospiraceae bacterium]|jgi:hypothetical protein|nr:hypothetical protein [Saprospiraceae bacterium]
MRKLHLMWMLVCIPGWMYCQTDTKVTNIIEGGKVLLEFTKLFVGNKKSNNSESSENSPCAIKLTADAVFINNVTQVIKVKLIVKSSQVVAGELVIQPGKSESLYELKEGVYTYEITDMTTAMVIRKGDIRYEHCENITTSIK